MKSLGSLMGIFNSRPVKKEGWAMESIGLLMQVAIHSQLRKMEESYV